MGWEDRAACAYRVSGRIPPAMSVTVRRAGEVGQRRLVTTERMFGDAGPETARHHADPA